MFLQVLGFQLLANFKSDAFFVYVLIHIWYDGDLMKVTTMKTREEIMMIRLRRLRRQLKSELRTQCLEEINEESLARLRKQAAAKKGLNKAPRD